jgi:hypothetical protein
VIEVRELDCSATGLARAADLLRAVFPAAKHVTPAYLDWQYVQNPDGPSLGHEAYEDGRLVSHAVVLPLRARLFGECVRGVLSLNAATHPSAQRSGVYFELARRTYELASEQGYSFGIAVTNDRSTPGFVKRVGFDRLGSLEARLGLASPRGVPGAPEAELERIWDERSAAWRLACPTRHYALRSRGDTLQVEGETGVPGIRVVLGALPRDLCAEAPDPVWLGTRPLRLWIGCDPALCVPASLPIPMRLRASPLHLIFKDLTGRDRRPDPGRIRWHALDFDDF